MSTNPGSEELDYEELSDVWDTGRAKLLVMVIEAKGFPQNFLPFVKATVATRVCRTKPLKNTNVVWNELFFYHDIPLDSSLSLELYVPNQQKKKEEITIGTLIIEDINSIPHDRPVDKWYPINLRINSKEGESPLLHLRILFSSVLETRASNLKNENVFTYEEHLSKFKTGDLIGYSCYGLLPSLTMLTSNSPISRVGIVLKMPNKWTRKTDLFIAEVTRNVDRMVDCFRESAGLGLNIFKLEERIYQFHGTSIFWCPLKKEMEEVYEQKMMQWIWSVHGGGVNLIPSIDCSFIKQWVIDEFGEKITKGGSQFVDLLSSTFVTECLRFGNEMPSQSLKVPTCAMDVMRYDCFNRPIPLRLSGSSGQSYLLQRKSISPSGVSIPSSQSSSSISNGSLGSPEVLTRRHSEPNRIQTSPLIDSQQFDERSMQNTIISPNPHPLPVRPPPSHLSQPHPQPHSHLHSHSQLHSQPHSQLHSQPHSQLHSPSPLNGHHNNNNGGNNHANGKSNHVNGENNQMNGGLCRYATFNTLNNNGKKGTRSLVIPDFQSAKLERFEKLGSGGFGAVYRCTVDGYTMAMKVMKINKNTKKMDITSVKTEVSILERAKHANIVQYLGYDFNRSELILFMEYLPTSLQKILLRKIEDHYCLQQNDPLEVRHFALEIAKGISYLHNSDPPIIHRDIKSGNVLVARDENEKILAVKLCDFGVAKICENKLSSANTIVGTPGLMAPEIRFGSSLYTEKVDIWSFGILLYEMIAYSSPRLPDIYVPPQLHPNFEPLLQVVISCLNDIPSLRPTAKQLVERLALMYTTM